MIDEKTEPLREAAFALPGVAVSTLTIFGLALNDVILLLTITLLCLQITWLVYRKAEVIHGHLTRKRRRKFDNREEEDQIDFEF